jgi:D-glycero-beta-D-manno-heptose-7-phosphate kinase
MREQWKDLAAIVAGFSGKRVVVLGDLVLDRFWYGTVQRLSREAPVPIVRLAETRLMPGCAANTAWNLASLGGAPVPVGVAGADREGEELMGLFARHGIAPVHVERWPGWVTPTKTRVLAGTFHGPKQQMVRVDSGEENVFDEALLKRLRDHLRAALDGADALIVSDYGYGTAHAVGARRYLSSVGISALDSRFDMEAFEGVATATPNEEEFERAIGKTVGDDVSLLEAEGEALRDRLGMKALLVTRGGKGMSLFERGRPPLHLPVVGSDQVVDVTGAGDTVISTYVLSLCSGATWPQAAAIANAAGGIVVQKHGTATTNQKELTRTLQEWGEGRL